MSSKDNKKSTNGNDERIREMNAELLVSSVRQHERAERADAAEERHLLSEEHLTRANVALENSNRDLERANAALGDSNRDLELANVALGDSNRGLERANIALEDSYDALERANFDLEDKRHAALNLMEDAVEARQKAERSEKALRESESKFRTLFETIDEGFVIVEMIFDEHDTPIDYRFVEANPAFSRHTGLPEDAVGKTARELVPDLEAFWFETYGKVALTGESVRFEHWSEPMGRWFNVHASRVGGEGSRLAIVFENITDRKLSEDALRQSEESYRTLFSNSPTAVFVCDQDAVIQRYNQQAAELWGREPECGVERHCGSIKLWLPNGTPLPHTQSPLIEVLRTGNPAYNVEVFIERPDGSRLPVLVNFAALKGERGEITGAITSFIDITDRKQAEAALRESEERFSKAFNASPLVLTISSLETGKLLEVNDTFVDITGFARDETIGKTTLEIGLWANPSDRDAEMDLVRTAGQLSNAEYVFKTREGREIIGLLAAERLMIAGEVCALTVIQDITERKHSEAALRESEARFRYASDSAPVQIWMSDQTMGLIWFNKPWLEFTGRSMDEQLVFGWADGLHPDDIDRYRNVYKTAFDARRQFTMEYRLRRADGEYRWLLEQAVPRFASDGLFLGYIGSSVDIHERREAESALRRSEARLQLAMRVGNFGTWDLNYIEDRMILSEKLFEILGSQVTPDRSLTVEQFDRLVHPDDAVKVAQQLLEARELRQVFSAEYRILRPDRAEPTWIQAVAQFFYDPAGKPVRSVGIVQDITESKAIAERIRASEAQLRLITDSIPALVSYIDRDERYRFVNRQYTEWFGKTSDEIVGLSMADLLGPEAYESLRPRVSEALAGKRVTFDTWLNYKDAGPKFAHISYVPNITPGGQVTGYYALVTDLTEQKRAEDLLRSSEKRMQMLTESFTDYAIISTDNDGRIDSWNPGAENIFGYSEEEILGSSADVLFIPEDVAKGVPLQEMSNARRTGRAIDERWHIKKDGTRFFASGVMAPLYVGDTLRGYAKIATDLTERKRNAEALQRAYDEMELRVLDRTRELADANESLVKEVNERKTVEREKITLLQRIVGTQEDERRRIARDLHDHLGQRLTALRLKLASLRDACKADEELFTRATRLQQIAELIDSEVSFLAWELRPSALDEFGLEEAIETFVKEWTRHYDKPAEFHSAGLKGLRLNPETETQLYRITQEALNNIIKHADARTVSVLLERSGDNIVLIIEDDGKGFDAERLLSSSKMGRGLGLFGMRERAELIGGTMDIESEPGHGTTVFVRIMATDLTQKHANEG